MAEQKSFQELQIAFAAHIRDPDRQPPPTDVEERRMAIYRDLFFNNLSSLLAGTFPVLHEILGSAPWDNLVRDFMVRHRCHTPYFHQVPEEFLEFLQAERDPAAGDPPFLLELAHYEWVELALTLAEEPPPPAGCRPGANLLEGVPVLSPLIWRLSYRFPVQHIGPDFQPAEPAGEPVYLAVFRDAEERVNFTELNPVTARLLELIEDNPARQTGRQLLSRIAGELGQAEPGPTIDGGANMLARLRNEGLLLGAMDG